MSDPLIKLFSDVLGVPANDLNDNSSPDTVAKWDSLAAMNLVSAIEDSFKVELSTREIIKMNTIGKARATLIEKGVPLQAKG